MTLIGVPVTTLHPARACRRAPGRDSPRSIVFADTLGLIPFWAKDAKAGYKMINARAETIAEKPAFREPFQSRRCLIPAEWILRMVEI